MQRIIIQQTLRINTKVSSSVECRNLPRNGQQNRSLGTGGRWGWIRQRVLGVVTEIQNHLKGEKKSSAMEIPWNLQGRSQQRHLVGVWSLNWPSSVTRHGFQWRDWNTNPATETSTYNLSTWKESQSNDHTEIVRVDKCLVQPETHASIRSPQEPKDGQSRELREKQTQLEKKRSME